MTHPRHWRQSRTPWCHVWAVAIAQLCGIDQCLLRTLVEMPVFRVRMMSGCVHIDLGDQHAAASFQLCAFSGTVVLALQNMYLFCAQSLIRRKGFSARSVSCRGKPCPSTCQANKLCNAYMNLTTHTPSTLLPRQIQYDARGSHVSRMLAHALCALDHKTRFIVVVLHV